MILSPPDAVAQDHRAARPPRQGAGVPGERLRLRTLVTLRWGAMGGQLLAIVLVRIVLGFDFPVVGCLGMIALSALLNLGLLLALPSNRLMFQWEASAQLGFDIFQLTGLLVLTGGVGNPFVVLLLVPVSLAASSLKGRDTLLLAGLAVAALFVLAAVSMPLPWFAGTSFAAPALYRWIAAAALAICIAVTATYARRAAAESARMELALHAAEAVLAREQRMSALGGLAAAAAHELGTPLATIAIVAKEMSRESPPGPMREDAELVSSQAQRCRDILRRLAEAPDTEDAVYARVSLPQLLEEIAGPDDHDDAVHVEWSVAAPPDSEPPELIRQPEIGHALTSFVENALDFAKSEVRLVGRYDYDTITIEVRDDGPGFSPEILAKLGEPYVTSRPSGENSRSGHLGMGLGFFIAKTLLERTGARVDFHNARNGGAVVAIHWPRSRIEAPPE